MFACRRCGARLDLANDGEPDTPVICPSCGTELGMQRHFDVIRRLPRRIAGLDSMLRNRAS